MPLMLYSFGRRNGNFSRILDSGNAYNYSVAKNEGEDVELSPGNGCMPFHADRHSLDPAAVFFVVGNENS